MSFNSRALYFKVKACTHNKEGTIVFLDNNTL